MLNSLNSKKCKLHLAIPTLYLVLELYFSINQVKIMYLFLSYPMIEANTVSCLLPSPTLPPRSLGNTTSIQLALLNNHFVAEQGSDSTCL